MKNIIIIFIKKLIGKELKKKLLNIYFYFKFKRYLKYDKDKDYQYNQVQFQILKLDFKYAFDTVKNLIVDYDNENLSYQYFIFAALKKKLLEQKIENPRILEIGTYDGAFANFLSKLFTNSKIVTIDLPVDDHRFINSYQRNSPDVLSAFLKKRSSLNKNSNIQFKELDSNEILNAFSKEKFDIIWVDGDHLNPQVSNDIENCLKLLNKNGFLCVDDVIKKLTTFNDRVSECSYLKLQQIENEGKLKNYFFLKRIRHNNLRQQKFISLSKLN